MRLGPRTLERLRAESSGPRYLKPGKGIRSRVLYRSADLDAWLEQSVFSSTPQYGERE